MMHGMDMSPADTGCDFPNPVDPAIQGPLPPANSSGPFAFAAEDEATMEYTAAVGHLRGTLRHAELPEYTVLWAPFTVAIAFHVICMLSVCYLVSLKLLRPKQFRSDLLCAIGPVNTF
jgi:hypothetical protein